MLSAVNAGIGRARSRPMPSIGEDGAGSRAAASAMGFTPVDSARQRRRVVNAPRLGAHVRAGARFERPEAGAA
ncbi:hypothetical protein [Streptomyces sp. NPDC005760]|uniref:hypothetical protein n=1 Tax=Streptomyces sp. NPDC005760 TaxID=3156718 RepID=UPI0033DB31E1